MSSQTRRRATTLVALTVAAVLGVSAGCDSGSEDDPMDDGSDPATAPTASPDSTAPSDPTMSDALQRSRRAFLDATLGLRSAGYAPTFGYTRYAICTDESADWRASANGRLNRQPPIGSSRADAEAIRDDLVGVGWVPYDTSTSPDGIRELTSHWIVTVERDDLTLNVSLYDEQPYILMRVLGPCLPATAEQRQEYETAEDQRFAVPAANHEDT
jgi:hypothetical protein